MLIKNSKVLTIGGKWLIPVKPPVPPAPDPYNPLNLPPYTLRLLYKDGVVPYFSKGTGVQISSSPNIWDLTYENSNWKELLYLDDDLLEVLGANTSSVTNMYAIFTQCTSLRSVSLFDTSNVTNMYCMFFHTAITTIPLFNTSNVTNMGAMFKLCASLISVPLFDTGNVTDMQSMFSNSTLTSIPLFNTSSVTDMSWMFYECYNVESGALALYQQASSQATPPTNHKYAFTNCGTNTQTGSAELAQIPSGWK